MDFSDFKKNRGKMKEALNKLREEKESTGKSDDTTYFPKQDADGNAATVIRILPQKDVAKHPIQTIRKHQAKRNNKYFSQVCLTTFEKIRACQLCMEAGAKWKELKDSGIDFPEVESYRKTTNIANILVVKDKNQPDYEGKVMKMYLAKDLVEMINDHLMPPKDDDGCLISEPVLVHDLWEGRNLNLIIRKKKNGFNDFSKSKFSADNTPVAPTEECIADIYNQLFDLEPDKSKVLSSDELYEKWNTFLQVNGDEPVKQEPKTDPVKEKVNTPKSEPVEEVNETTESVDEVIDDEEVPW